MNRFLPWSVVIAATFSSCAKTAKVEQEKQLNPIGLAGKPLIRSGTADEGTPVAAGGNQPPKPIIGITPDSDIIYTDPDAPDADIPELASLLAAPKRGPWEESETIAKQLSVREGKPLLIWFTDSQGSPMCKAVSDELFSTHEFGGWAMEKLVRLKIDSTPDKERLDKTADLGSKEDLRIRMLSYASDLKKRYKVMGYPSLVMLSPSGEVVGRYRGYKRGEADYLWGQLKHAEAVSSEAYKGWRQGLEKKGYREWQDRKGRKVFARLTSYSNGTLTFIEPDGTRSRTSESKLSDSDRAWITEQKKLRHLQQ
jgi:Thioredoxin-like domain